MEATVIEYRKYTDIDIKFENGCIREHVRYSNFKEGKVSPINMVKTRFRNDRIGETIKQYNGTSATIIAYRSAKDIDIKYETGEIRNHVNYYLFIEGRLIPKT